MPWTAGRPVGVALRVGDASYRVIGVTVAEEGDSTVIAAPAVEALGTGGDTLNEEGQQISYSFVRVSNSSLVPDPTWPGVPTLTILGSRMLKSLLRAYYQRDTDLTAAEAEMHSAQSDAEPAFVVARAGLPNLAAGSYGPTRGRRTPVVQAKAAAARFEVCQNKYCRKKGEQPFAHASPRTAPQPSAQRRPSFSALLQARRRPCDSSRNCLGRTSAAARQSRAVWRPARRPRRAPPRRFERALLLIAPRRPATQVQRR